MLHAWHWSQPLGATSLKVSLSLISVPMMPIGLGYALTVSAAVCLGSVPIVDASLSETGTSVQPHRLKETMPFKAKLSAGSTLEKLLALLGTLSTAEQEARGDIALSAKLFVARLSTR